MNAAAERQRCFERRKDSREWFSTGARIRVSWDDKETSGRSWDEPDIKVGLRVIESSQALEATFRQLATQWLEQSRRMSSVTEAIELPAYQAIIKLGWDVVPFLLKDLQDKRGFWFPALSAITGIRPFDRKDAGNSRRMTQAWLDWGRKKGLI